MSIPTRLSSYLDKSGTRYEISAHKHSRSSVETAHAAHVQPHQLAKSVIVEDEAGCVMAVVPADKVVMLGYLSQLLGRKELRLSDEDRIAALFDDCDRGAVPPLGMAWGLETIVDDELDAADVVYMESGDHVRLLHLSHDEFHALMSQARHGHFCKTPLY